MQDKILKILKKSDSYVSGQEISEKLGVSRQAVWKAVNALKEQGFVIDSVTNKGYRLVSSPLFLNASSVKSNLNTKIIGKELKVVESVGSTNDYLKNLGNNGCKNGMVVAAREQTSGKGRLGRVWQAKKDDCLMFSFLLRPKIAPCEVSSVTPLAGLAVCKALRKFTGINCMIKWPNDIIAGRKKLVGILTEMSAEFDAVEYIVTGIGINSDAAQFPEEIANKATSIFLESGKHVNKNELLCCVLEYIENEFSANNLQLSDAALSQYTDMCATIGRNVTFFRDGKSFDGIAVGVNNSGELKVMLSDGSVCFVNSGEVTVQGIY